MPQQVVFFVHYRLFSPDEQQCAAVIHTPHLVRRHQLPGQLLAADGVGPVSSPGGAPVPHIQGLLAQHLRDVFMGGLLVPAQIQQRVGVAQQSLPFVLKQRLQPRDILQHNGGHDVPGAHGALYLPEVAGQGHIAKLVHHQPHRHRQRPLMHLVRLVVKGLKRAGIEHPHQVIKGAVAVGDHGKYRLLSLPHAGKLHFVTGCNAPNFRDNKGRQPHRCGNEDGPGRFARRLLENMVFPHGNMVRLLILQRLKQQVQRGAVRLVLLAGPAVFQHIQHRFKVLLLRGRFIQQIQHQRRVQSHLRPLPKRVTLLGVLGRSVLNEVIHQLHHILGIPDIGKGVKSVRMARINEVKHPQHIPLLQQQRRQVPEHFALGVRHQEAAVYLHDIGLAEIPRLTGTAAAHDDLQQIPPVLPPVETHSHMAGQQGVVGRVFVRVFPIELPRTAPPGGAVFLPRPAVFPAGIIQDHRTPIEQQKHQ